MTVPGEKIGQVEFCTVEPCASAKAYEIKFTKKININKAREALGDAVLSSMPVVLLCKIRGKPVSIYASGRAMIKEANAQEADAIAKILSEKLRGAME